MLQTKLQRNVQIIKQGTFCFMATQSQLHNHSAFRMISPTQCCMKLFSLPAPDCLFSSATLPSQLLAKVLCPNVYQAKKASVQLCSPQAAQTVSSSTVIQVTAHCSKVRVHLLA